MGQITNYTKNLIGSILALSVTDVMYDTMFSPPEWGAAGVSLLVGIATHFYLSLSDDIKKLEATDG